MIDELSQLFSAFQEKSNSDILIGCIASIESHNTGKMTADIKPLLFFLEGEKRSDYTVIPDVPVLFINAGGYLIRPKYKRGDLVWVAFSNYEIASPLEAVPADASTAVFSRENASVIAGIAGKKFSAPAGFDEDGIIITHESGGMVFHLQQDKIKAKAALFEIEGDLKVSGKVDAGAEITWMAKSTPTKASTHIHNTGVGPSSPPNAGS